MIRMIRPLTVRAATTDDGDPVARLSQVVARPWAESVASYRKRRQHEQPPINGIRLVAEEDGRIVGAATAKEALEGLLPQPGVFSAKVAVDPDAADRGIGRALWAELVTWLAPQNPRQLVSWTDRHDSRSVAVAAHWGFTRRPGSVEDPEDLASDEPWAWHFELDLTRTDTAAVDPAAGAAPDIETISLIDAVDDHLLSALHQAHEECRADVPSWEAYQPTSRREFRERQVQRLADAGTGLVAHRRGHVVAATFAERIAFLPDFHNDFTMVHRTARGQGLVLAVKQRFIRQAAAPGIERITTEVRTDNPRMVAVNAALGFRRTAMRQLVHEGPGSAGSPPASRIANSADRHPPGWPPRAAHTPDIKRNPSTVPTSCSSRLSPLPPPPPPKPGSLTKQPDNQTAQTLAPRQTPITTTAPKPFGTTPRSKRPTARHASNARSPCRASSPTSTTPAASDTAEASSAARFPPRKTSTDDRCYRCEVETSIEHPEVEAAHDEVEVTYRRAEGEQVVGFVLAVPT